MKKQIILYSSFFLITLGIRFSYSQNEKNVKNAITFLSYDICEGTTNLPKSDLKWRFALINEPPEPVTNDPDKIIIDSLKAIKLIQKLAVLKSQGTSEESESLFAAPVVGTNFNGNTNGGNPPDNSIAISNGGKILSVVNNSIAVYSTSGTNLMFETIPDWWNSTSPAFVADAVSDPIVVYDKMENRFIFVCLASSSDSINDSNNERILIAYSKTSDPAGAWWKYAPAGDVLNNGCWADRPNIAVTNAELIVTVNLYRWNPVTGENDWEQPVIKQIDKLAGYSGSTTTSLIWSSIIGYPSTLLPIGHGHGSSSYGPAFYLVNTISSGSNIIKLYKITDDISGSPTLTYNSVNTTAYSPAADAVQLNSTDILDVGDCRALSGFILNGIIHFVTNTETGNGFSGIRYYRLNTNTPFPSVTAKNFSSSTSNKDYAYPAIAAYSTSSTDKSVMIGFCSVSASSYASVRVINCDNSGTWFGSINVKSGNSFIDIGGTEERWGDYCGMARKHNSATPSVWLSGSFANSSNKYNTRIAEIHSSALADKNSTDNQDAISETKIFPLPVIESFFLEFNLPEEMEITITIFDEKGSIVRELYKGFANNGQNVLSFNKANLVNGIYFLVATDNENKMIINEKIIIAR